MHGQRHEPESWHTSTSSSNAMCSMLAPGAVFQNRNRKQQLCLHGRTVGVDGLVQSGSLLLLLLLHCTAAPSNGKVFDARSTTWTTTSSSNTSRQQQQQQPNGPNYTTTGSLFGSSPGSGAGGSSGTCGSGSRCRSGSGCSPCGVGQKRQLLGDAAAAAACGQVAANCAAEAERRRQAEQAELRVRRQAWGLPKGLPSSYS